MNKLVSLLGLAATLLLAGNTKVSAQTWGNLTQAQKNQRIIAVANAEIGKVVPEECKEWVRRMVKTASQNTRDIPSTSGNGYSWNMPFPNVVQVQGPYPIQWTVPGQLIQMRFKDGNIHTAIIGAVFSQGVYFLDSNWYYRSDPKRVYCHYLDYQSLYASLSGYTIYTIQ